MKKKEIFHFLNKEITTQTAQKFFLYYIWGNSKMSISLLYQIMFICNKTKQKKLKVAVVERVGQDRQDLCSGNGVSSRHNKNNVDITNHTYNIERARKKRLESLCENRYRYILNTNI